MQIIPFDKYEKQGAYHWLECDRTSSQYNPPLEARYEVLVRRVKKMVDINHVLDVGCGDGYLMAQVSPYAELITGVDSEPMAVQLANKKFRSFINCQAIQGNCYALPFDEESFDVILFSDVIEHLANPERCLAELRRALSAHGSLLVTTPKWRPDRMWDTRHVKEYKARELQECLEPFFKQIDISYFWPIGWSNVYSTRIGWKLMKPFSRYLFNPFMKESRTHPNKYGQMLVMCRERR